MSVLAVLVVVGVPLVCVCLMLFWELWGSVPPKSVMSHGAKGEVEWINHLAQSKGLGDMEASMD